MEKKKKFDWLAFFKIVGAVVTCAGVIFSLITGSILGNNIKIFGVITMPLFGWIVALLGFFVFLWARYCQAEILEKQRKAEEFQKQQQQNGQPQSKQPRRGNVVLIKKKDLVDRKPNHVAEEKQQNSTKTEDEQKKSKKKEK